MDMTRWTRALLISAAVALTGFVAAQPALATFPGENGLIAFQGTQAMAISSTRWSRTATACARSPI